MKKTFLFLFLILNIHCFRAQVNVPLHAFMILKNMEKFHYQPRGLDDEFGRLVCDNTISALDKSGIYFTKENIAELRLKSVQIATDIPNEKKTFLDAVNEVFAKSLENTESILKVLESKKLVYTDETLSINLKDLFIPQAQRLTHWEKIIKFRILSEYCYSSDSLEILGTPDAKKIEELKKEVLQDERDRIQAKRDANGGLAQFIGEAYLKAIASAFDPHSSYFTVEDESDFSDFLSKEVMSFGFSLIKNDEGEYEIESIVPGSPAWKSNQLNEEDVLIKATARGKKLIFENAKMKEVRAFLMDEDNGEIHLWVRKKTGEEIDFELTKDAIEVEDNLIESYILDGEEKIAYIYLPSFYSKGDEVFSLSTGCANDVAKELIHLQNEGVTGLILDLRNNGGGSMLESLLLAGIFVDYGAISIYGSKDQVPITMKDLNKGVLFDKPMVVMVNQFSASASELFAAAMQDRNRALIIGSTTYGKSTAQTVMPITAFKLEENQDKTPEAYIKITGGAFYRVTGKTHQSEGIVPDVHLPNYYEFGEYNEKFEPGALILPAIEKKTYYFPLPDLPKDLLKSKSELRISQNELFNTIVEGSREYEQDSKVYKVSLNFEKFKKDLLDDDEEFEFETKDYDVKNPTYIQGRTDVHIGSQELNNMNIKNIREDLYINEAFYIIKDLIQTQK